MNGDRYEYLVTYKGRDGLFLRKGRIIKQTRKAADKLVQWAQSHQCEVRLQRRTVGEWEDTR